MSQSRVDDLLAKLVKGHQKTCEYFGNLTQVDWQSPLYGAPDWRVHNLLAHFVSAEEHLLELSQNVAGGGSGAPEGFDIDRFNAQEQERNLGRTTQELLNALDRTRQRTIDWVRTLSIEQLDRRGRHPTLGIISVEALITAIYGHQILHMRDLARLQRSKTGNNA